MRSIRPGEGTCGEPDREPSGSPSPALVLALRPAGSRPLAAAAAAAMDEQRKLLDQLMGSNRNGEAGASKHFSDRDICRLYLVGLCPHDLFGNTVRPALRAIRRRTHSHVESRSRCLQEDAL